MYKMYHYHLHPIIPYWLHDKLSFTLSQIHTNTQAQAHAHAHTHTNTHTHDTLNITVVKIMLTFSWQCTSCNRNLQTE